MAYQVRLSKVSYNPPNSRKGILHDVSFVVEPGEFVSLVGRNGNGKTSVIRAIAGELDINDLSGEIVIGVTPIDKPVHEAIAGVGIVHQFIQDDLIEELSIKTNIRIRQAFGNRKALKQVNSNDWTAGVNQRLAEFIKDKEMKVDLRTRAGTLSGGQQQILNILIAFEFEHPDSGCELLLLDEPMTGLDFIVRNQVIDLIDKLTVDVDSEPRKTTIIMVVHDLLLALDKSDKIFIIKNGTAYGPILRDSPDWNIEYLQNNL